MAEQNNVTEIHPAFNDNEYIGVARKVYSHQRGAVEAFVGSALLTGGATLTAVGLVQEPKWLLTGLGASLILGSIGTTFHSAIANDPNEVESATVIPPANAINTQVPNIGMLDQAQDAAEKGHNRAVAGNLLFLTAVLGITAGYAVGFDMKPVVYTSIPVLAVAALTWISSARNLVRSADIYGNWGDRFQNVVLKIPGMARYAPDARDSSQNPPSMSDAETSENRDSEN